VVFNYRSTALRATKRPVVGAIEAARYNQRHYNPAHGTWAAHQ